MVRNQKPAVPRESPPPYVDDWQESRRARRTSAWVSGQATQDGFEDSRLYHQRDPAAASERAGLLNHNELRRDYGAHLGFDISIVDEDSDGGRTPLPGYEECRRDTPPPYRLWSFLDRPGLMRSVPRSLRRFLITLSMPPDDDFARDLEEQSNVQEQHMHVEAYTPHVPWHRRDLEFLRSPTRYSYILAENLREVDEDEDEDETVEAPVWGSKCFLTLAIVLLVMIILTLCAVLASAGRITGSIFLV